MRDAYSATQEVVELTLERERLALRGIPVEDVTAALSGALGGVQATEFREIDRRTPISVRFAGPANENLEAALATVVHGVPVGQLVQVKETRAPIEVVRVNQRPVSIVEAVVERGGTSRAASDVRGTLSKMPMPAGLTWQVAGADVEQRRTTSELGIVAILSVALVYPGAGRRVRFVHHPRAGDAHRAARRRRRVHRALGHRPEPQRGLAHRHGGDDRHRGQRRRGETRRHPPLPRGQGYPINEAIKLGGRQRLRAIAMTSLTTIVGVAPLIFGWGSGGELYQPLAAGIIGGSVSATLVTFFLLPTAYSVLEGRKDGRAEGRKGATA